MKAIVSNQPPLPKFLVGLIGRVLLFVMLMVSTAEAAPTFVLMKFTDDTRYDLIESAESLSDLVMEKLIASGKVTLKETYPLDEKIEAQLYDEKMRDLRQLETAFETNEFNALFESEGFDENKAQSIATAQVGQIITPEITSAIGLKHGADYLIQGTIINLGTGGWWNESFERLSDDVNKASALHGISADMGAISDVMTIDITTTGVGVQCDVRIIEAATGKVIWTKRVVGVHEQKSFDFLFMTIGNRKLNNNLYAKAMNKAADKIVAALVDDLNAGLLSR